MMSNALYLAVVLSQASAPATQPAEAPASPLMLALLGAGVCVLAVWIIQRLIRPQRLMLTRAPGRPSLVNPLHVLVGFLGYLLGALGGVSVSVLLLPKESAEAVALTAAVATTLWLGVNLLAARRAFPRGLARGMGLTARHWLFDSLRGLLGFLAVLPVCLLLLRLSEVLIPKDLRALHELLVAARQIGRGWKALIALSAVVLAPLAEEIFFRGLLQTMLRKYLRSPWLAILITSSVFALFHVPYYHTMLTLFALGVALGYNYERCGRLLPAILLHAAFNAFNIAVFFSQGA